MARMGIVDGRLEKKSAYQHQYGNNLETALRQAVVLLFYSNVQIVDVAL